jgi:hypothetical protein
MMVESNQKIWRFDQSPSNSVVLNNSRPTNNLSSAAKGVGDYPAHARDRLAFIRKQALEKVPVSGDQVAQLLSYVQDLEVEYAAALTRITTLEEKVRDLTEQTNLYSLEAMHIDKLVSYPNGSHAPIPPRTESIPIQRNDKSEFSRHRNRKSVSDTLDPNDYRWDFEYSDAAESYTDEKSFSLGSTPDSYMAAFSAGNPPKVKVPALKSPFQIRNKDEEFLNFNKSTFPSIEFSHDLPEFSEEEILDVQKRGVMNFFLRRNGWFNYRPGDIVMRCRIYTSTDLDEVKQIMPNLKVGTEKNNKLVKAHISLDSGYLLSKMEYLKKGSLSLIR